MKNNLEFVKKNISLNANANTPTNIVEELLDIKLIMLAIACKLGEEERKDLINGLSSIQSPRIAKWLETFREFTGD